MGWCCCWGSPFSCVIQLLAAGQKGCAAEHSDLLLLHLCSLFPWEPTCSCCDADAPRLDALATYRVQHVLLIRRDGTQLPSVPKAVHKRSCNCFVQNTVLMHQGLGQENKGALHCVCIYSGGIGALFENVCDLQFCHLLCFPLVTEGLESSQLNLSKYFSSLLPVKPTSC